MSHWAKYTVKPHSQNSISIIRVRCNLGRLNYLFLGDQVSDVQYVPNRV